MIRINQLKLDYRHREDELSHNAASLLKISPNDLMELKIVKKSIDARKDTSGKHQIRFIYTVDVSVKNEKKCLARIKDKNISQVQNKKYCFTADGDQILKNRPVIAGSGPAGLFCALMLARAGYRPLVI